MAKETATATEPTPAPDYSGLVDAWFLTHFHDRGPVITDEAYNIANTAKDDLKARLAALSTQ